MELNAQQMKTKTLGHLGLVAATIQRLKLIEKIDQRIPLDQEKGGVISHGKRTAAMILNGLGFINSRLYLSPWFFHDKPVSTLLGPEVTAEGLNDDCLGRCLDKIAEYGTTQLLSEVCFEIAQEQGLLSSCLRLDTTSLSLTGEYAEAHPDAPGPFPTFGYSKDHRPDLKQVVLSLVQMGPAQVPVWMEALDGNSSDKQSFHETVRKVQSFVEGLQQGPEQLCFVVDAAFFDQQQLAALEGVRWISRVPLTVKAAREYQAQPFEAYPWQPVAQDPRYWLHECPTPHTHPGQRWILVTSKPAYERELRTFRRKLAKHFEKASQRCWHLGNERFTCVQDAEKAARKFSKELRYFGMEYTLHEVPCYRQRGRPRKEEAPASVYYRIETCLYSDLECIRREQNSLGRFIVATNVLDKADLSNEDVFHQYKGQHAIEAGFKFIKESTFGVDGIFLKSQRRIGALMLIMTLCLMVYQYAQHALRKLLETQDEVLPNQLGKPVKNPTLQWIFALMSCITVVEVRIGGTLHCYVTNVHPLHQKIITFFGETAKAIYDIPDHANFEQITLNPKNWLSWCGM